MGTGTERTHQRADTAVPVKKIPFDSLTQRQLDKIVNKINNRLCKVLGYLTFYEVFSP
jgi:IS30 family transposase